MRSRRSAAESAPSSIVRRIIGPPPFDRLVWTNTLSPAADAFFTVSLAGSLFFNVSIGAARPRVVAYLLLTLAPFVLLAPLVGPLIDRYGRVRPAVLASTCLGRGILCLFVAGDLRNVLLYPEAFGVLVLEKAYSVAKSATVPALVPDHSDLVAANARLARISTIGGLLGGGAAAAVLSFTSATPVLRIGSLFYFGAAIVAMGIPSKALAPAAPPSLQAEQRQTRRTRFASAAMSVLRASIGFLVFLVAFELKRAAEPTWLFGAVAAVSIGGGLLGTIVGPALRRRLRRDESLLTIALVLAAVVALGAAARPERAAIATAVFAIAFAVSTGRQGFDSIVQRNTRDVSRARAFARFETLFQLSWVLGALAGVVFQPTTRGGLVAVGIVFLVTLVAYLVGTMRRPYPPSAFVVDGQ
jgi:MFS family permease